MRIRVRWWRFRTKSCIFLLVLVLAFFLLKSSFIQSSFNLSSVFRSKYASWETFLFSNYSAKKREKFRPAKFLDNIVMENTSFCDWGYGLPNLKKFSEENMRYSPQLGKASEHQVIIDVLRGTKSGGRTNVTLVTHATPEFLPDLAEVVKRWEGPVSVASFVPAEDAGRLICALEKLCRCMPEMSRVSLHLVFPIAHLPILGHCSIQGTHSCSLHTNDTAEPTYRHSHQLSYPVNVARNTARIRAETEFLLVSDVELLPSYNLVTKFVSMMISIKSKSKTNFDVFLRKIVYVVPVFEVEWYESVPEYKSQLIEMYEQNRAFYFHRWVCSHCQRFPGLQRWLMRKKESLDHNIEPFFVVKREYPFHRWEPVFIGTHAEPFYTELLTWEGQQDKMTQMHEMCLLEYRFVILDGAFLIHSPGVKRKSSQTSTHADQVAANSRVYDTVADQLAKTRKHNARCRRH